MKPQEFEREILKALSNLSIVDVKHIRKEVESIKYENEPAKGLTSSNNSCKIRLLNKERGKKL